MAVGESNTGDAVGGDGDGGGGGPHRSRGSLGLHSIRKLTGVAGERGRLQ